MGIGVYVSMCVHGEGIFRNPGFRHTEKIPGHLNDFFFPTSVIARWKERGTRRKISQPQTRIKHIDALLQVTHPQSDTCMTIEPYDSTKSPGQDAPEQAEEKG